MQSPAELEIARALPPPGCALADAERYTRCLATRHYENFHVVSWVLPRRLHQHFYNVYAYCRWADDLGDEIANPSRALELLDGWEHELDLCYAGRPSHPVFVALAPTVRAFDIPIEPFRDLLVAFRQDQIVHGYESWTDMLGYCRFSANPVGRLVLYLCGYRDAERQRLSDATCTALQLANFWQDVSRDLDKGRIYIPREAMRRHGLAPDEIEARHFDERYVALMKELLARTRVLFAQGAPLVSRVDARLRVDLDLFGRGGLAVLDAIEAQGYNTLEHRPAIGPATRARLAGRAVLGLVRASLASRTNPTRPNAAPGSSNASSPGHQSAGDPVAESYAECRRLARAAASNFYYAFYMLPRPKRDALCALYAFMRLLDDVSDVPGSLTDSPDSVDATAAKRAALSHWRAMLDQTLAGDAAAHPILPAFADTIRRYQIPPRYFHDLISGVEMDLTETRYATFERLREYCYRVAGTVGLTCLHAFGFDDPHAPELAERLGIAFQLTNIVRDVGADLALGRVYLPAEDLARFGCSPEQLARGVVTPAVRELLRFEAERAWRFYAEGSRLLRLVHRDSRAALWALTRIYSALLARIEERDFDVFSSRVRLTAAEKAAILLRARLGWWSEADVLEERDRDRRRAGGAFLGRRAG
jgi:squalene synthase HpnC/squalene synthase HpnD